MMVVCWALLCIQVSVTWNSLMKEMEFTAKSNLEKLKKDLLIILKEPSLSMENLSLNLLELI